MKTLNCSGSSSYVELSMVGADGSRPPSISGFPTKFNPRALEVWRSLLQSKQYERAKGSFRNLDENWSWCIRKYLVLCTRAGKFPFNGPTEQSNNDAVISFLTTARRRAIEYLDRIDLFSKVSVFQSSRTYLPTSESLTVLTEAQLYRISDPTFTKWLLTQSPGPMFRTIGSTLYEREVFDNLDSKAVFRFDAVNMARPILRMEISCSSPVAYSRNLKVPSSDDLKKFIESSIWLPLVRSHRFKNIGNRLF